MVGAARKVEAGAGARTDARERALLVSARFREAVSDAVAYDVDATGHTLRFATTTSRGALIYDPDTGTLSLLDRDSGVEEVLVRGGLEDAAVVALAPAILRLELLTSPRRGEEPLLFATDVFLSAFVTHPEVGTWNPVPSAASPVGVSD
jgi:hypothetical protein